MTLPFEDVRLEGTNLDVLSDEQLDDKLEKPDEEETTPSESSTEKEEEKETPPSGDDPEKDAGDKTDENNLPFHKHPRWQELIKEREELKAFKQTAEERLKEFEAKLTTLDTRQEEEEIIDPEFVELFGSGENTVEAWKVWKRMRSKEKEAWIKEVETRLTEQAKKQTEETQKWENWVESQVKALEISGKEFDRNKLLKVISDYKPTDEQGNLDFTKGYEIYKLVYPKVEKHDEGVEVKKKIISEKPVTNTGVKKSFVTPSDVRFKSMQSLATED